MDIDADDLLKLYEHCNRQYFDGQLPSLNIRIHPAKEEDPGLVAEYNLASGTISFFSSDDIDESLIRTTLLHEMVHVAVPEDGHGASFRAELQRLADFGSEDAEFEVWRMVGDQAWDDGWIGDQSGRWERFRGDDVD